MITEVQLHKGKRDKDGKKLEPTVRVASKEPAPSYKDQTTDRTEDKMVARGVEMAELLGLSLSEADIRKNAKRILARR